MTEHSVVYEIPGGTRTIMRQVWESAGRILGTEVTRDRVYGGCRDAVNPWKETSRDTETRQFHSRAEASAWMDAMFRDREIAGVAANGGTKLIVLA